MKNPFNFFIAILKTFLFYPLNFRYYFSTTLVVRALCYQYWRCRVFYWSAWFKKNFKNIGARRKHKFYGLRFDADAKILSRWDLILRNSLVKTTNNKQFEYTLLKDYFFHYYHIVKNKIEHLLLYLLFFNNNWYRNVTWKAFELIRAK